MNVCSRNTCVVRLLALPVFVAPLFLAAVLFPASAAAQDSPDFFQANCMNCHTIGGGRLSGPDLKNVEDGKDREWLIRFMMNPKSVIDSGDKYAAKLLDEYRAPMPTLPGMTRQRCEDLLDLIKAESKLEKSRFEGLKISTKEFTAADRKMGRRLFLGTKRLEAGGAACVSCHSMHDISSLGGGRLGPDLTNIYERLKGRKAVSAWLVAPATETMQPIFKNRPMNSEEIHALAAYFESSAGESPSQPAASRVALLVFGLLGATAVIFGFDAIWKRRFSGVRQPLVEASALPTPRSTEAH